MSARRTFQRIAALCLSALALATVSGSTPQAVDSDRLPFYDSADFSPSWTPSAHTIADFALLDQRGETVTRDDLRGKVSVVSFIFTSCRGICPKIVGNLKQVQHAFAGDAAVQMLSYSVWPQVDKVSILDRYAEDNGIDADQWHLLTGDRDAIYALARESYFADAGADDGRDDQAFVHTENVVLIDGSGRIRGVYNGTDAFDMERLIEDVAILRARG